MGSEVAAALIGAGGAVLGGLVAAGATLRATLPYRKQAAVQRTAALIELRYTSYQELVVWMAPYFDERGEPKRVPADVRREHSARMRSWFYEKGGALLLSGNAFNAFRHARDLLLAPDDKAPPTDVSKALSALRTELKIDISSRQPSERARQFAPSEEQTWGG